MSTRILTANGLSNSRFSLFGGLMLLAASLLAAPVAADEITFTDPATEAGSRRIAGTLEFQLVPGSTLPAAAVEPVEARRLLERHRKTEAALRRGFQQELHAEKRALLERLRALRERLVESGRNDEARAVREIIRRFETELLDERDDPGTLTSYRNRTGETLVFRVTGNPAAGNVWGTDVYTDDSSLAAAVVHAGVLDAGETGLVAVTLLSGRDSYDGSTRNGVTSYSYGNWVASYRVERHRQPPTFDDSGIQRDPGNLAGRARPAGASYLFRITGTTDGGVWGTDVYSSDSDLSTAAVHAGLVKPGETAVIKATILPGQSVYTGSTRNGVTSRNWQSWGASYRLSREGGVGDRYLKRASVDDKYSRLLRTLHAPQDRAQYGDFRDYGYWTGTAYLGHDDLPAAFWVYVAPTWYLWAESKDGLPAPYEK